VGADALQAAIVQADEAGTYGADALALLLTGGPPLPPTPPLALTPPAVRPGLPPQSEIDRALSVYEAWVEIDEALPEAAR
jgi:hypothetical protein